MKAEELREIAIKALEDMKGIDITVMDVRTLTSITDYMIICTSRSTRHGKALAETVSTTAKENKASFVRMEGEQEAEWILVDLGNVIIHAMLPEIREYYELEKLWSVDSSEMALA
jgi:ribosome-associated protein